MVETGQQLWAPTPGRIERARITEFLRWLKANRGLTFADFESLWRWSTEDLDGFWQACWDFFGVEATKQPTAVLGKRTMPGAEWFPGAELNYARHMLRHERPDAAAVLHLNERQALQSISWEELGGKVRIVATQLRKLGVKRGDRVVRLHDQCSRGADRDAGDHQHRRHLVIRAARTSERPACWTASRSSSRRCSSTSTATSTAASRSTDALRWRKSSRA